MQRNRTCDIMPRNRVRVRQEGLDAEYGILQEGQATAGSGSVARGERSRHNLWGTAPPMYPHILNLRPHLT